VEGTKRPAGTLESLRALGATLVDAVETRLELAIVELREEGERRKSMLVLAVTGALFASMGLMLVAFLVVVLFWDTHRLAAIGGVTLLYLGIAAVAFWRLREAARSSPPPFEATMRELAADRDMLGSRHE